MDATRIISGKDWTIWTGSPLTGKRIENVYTADATPSQLAPGASGSDAGGKGVLWALLMVQRE
jgi:hypothetical protein